MIFALAFLQVMSSILSRFLGSRRGAVLTGFFGGLISSTATTASLAKRSQSSRREDVFTEVLTFLAATLAMLFEGAAILLLGTKDSYSSLLMIVAGPGIVTVVLMMFLYRKAVHTPLAVVGNRVEFLPLFKLSAFMIGILALSRVLQVVFGQTGILAFTFLVSLFEIHGSIIANVQLYNAGLVDMHLLGGLLTISIAASYLSKVFLIYTIGSSALRGLVLKCTTLLVLSLVASWFVFVSQTLF